MVRFCACSPGLLHSPNRNFNIDRPETESQILGFSGAIFKGYTAAQGGLRQARTDHDARVKSMRQQQQQSSGGSTSNGTCSSFSNLSSERSSGHVTSQDSVSVSQPFANDENVSSSPGFGTLETNFVSPHSWEDGASRAAGTTSTTRGTALPTSNSSRPTKRSGDALAHESMPAVKKTCTSNILKPVENNFNAPRNLMDVSETKNGNKELSSERKNDGSEVLSRHSRINTRFPGAQTRKERHATSSNSHDADHLSPQLSGSDDEFGSRSIERALSDAFCHKAPQPDVPLCKEQADLVDLILSGRNVFYTGSAGTGKSTVMKHFVPRLISRGKHVSVVAPTGRAALNVRGRTFWSYAGWTPFTNRRPMEKLLKDCHQPKRKERFQNTHVLVIDEISMMENFHFERLNRIMKASRQYKSDNPDPFGGVQTIVSGDFWQLPPVDPMQYCLECGLELQKMDGNRRECSVHGTYHVRDKWAFRSDAWRECDFEHVNLKTIHRQKDARFIEILEKVKLFKPLSEEDKSLLKNHRSDTKNGTKLFVRKDSVREANLKKFGLLALPEVEYQCLDHFCWNKNHWELDEVNQRDEDGSLVELNDHDFERNLKVRVGMFVMLLVNYAGGDLVNGSQGTVIGFDSSPVDRDLKEISGEYAGLRKALCSKFAKGQEAWPVVRFLDGRERTIIPACRVNELGASELWSLISRTQVPLTAAWAMTVHKAQGMTLDKVQVDLSGVFAKGHHYSALSRARCVEGLKVDSLGELDMGPDLQVKEHHEERFGPV